MIVKKNLLLTGQPGVGKTTLITKLAHELAPFSPAGFYTAEIRERGERKGFTLVSLDGRTGVLSHVDIKGPYHVGKYRVDVRGFENFLDRLPFSDPAVGILIIDEIGKMECLSEKFKKLVARILESERPLVATIALMGSGFIEEIKGRPDVTLIEVAPRNRDALLRELATRMREVLQREEKDASSRRA